MPGSVAQKLIADGASLEVAYGQIIDTKAAKAQDGGDILNLSAVGGKTLTTAFNVDKSVNVVTDATSTPASVALLFADSATAQTHVYVAVNTLTNIASIYAVVDSAGVAAGSVTATLAGTIDLADTIWATLTAENFG